MNAFLSLPSAAFIDRLLGLSCIISCMNLLDYLISLDESAAEQRQAELITDYEVVLNLDTDCYELDKL